MACRLRKLAGEIDVLPIWPLEARRTRETAARLGVPTVLEHQNGSRPRRLAGGPLEQVGSHRTSIEAHPRIAGRRSVRGGAAPPYMDDLAVILVSNHGARRLRPCLRSLQAQAADLSVDVVVVCNFDDGSEQIVAEEFLSVGLLRCENRGLAHSNNQVSPPPTRGSRCS